MTRSLAMSPSHGLLLSLSLLALTGTSAAETVHGVVVYSRHGDRTTKHYGGQQLTSLGAQQCFQVGSDYRARYVEDGSAHQILGISADKYVPAQVYASAPDQAILLNTATAFLQGLYPPLVDLNNTVASTTLNNGTRSTAPLNGYQYVVLHGENADSPDTIWIKGDDGCPANAAAGKSFFQSAEYKARLEATRDFYAGFHDELSGVYDMEPEDMSYANAYDIFDLINVARIHNTSSPALQISDADFFQLRTLADSAEFGYNFNASQPARQIHARTLAAGILAQLNQTVTSRAKLKFSLLAGSYDTFQAFFGLTGLTQLSNDFFGLPDYASTMAFEVFSPADTTSFPADPAADLRVRFLFRNSTFGELTAWPLFGSGQDSLPWSRFVDEMKTRSVSTAAEWCSLCASTLSFCAAFNKDGSAGGGVSVSGPSSSGGGISNAAAGVIGAMVTLAVVAIVGGVLFVVLKRRNAAKTGAGGGAVVSAPSVTEKGDKASLQSGSANGSGQV